jgi:hypothetical protein
MDFANIEQFNICNKNINIDKLPKIIHNVLDKHLLMNFNSSNRGQSHTTNNRYPIDINQMTDNLINYDKNIFISNYKKMLDIENSAASDYYAVYYTTTIAELYQEHFFSFLEHLKNGTDININSIHNLNEFNTVTLSLNENFYDTPDKFNGVDINKINVIKSAIIEYEDLNNTYLDKRVQLQYTVDAVSNHIKSLSDFLKNFDEFVGVLKYTGTNLIEHPTKVVSVADLYKYVKLTISIQNRDIESINKDLLADLEADRKAAERYEYIEELYRNSRNEIILELDNLKTNDRQHRINLNIISDTYDASVNSLNRTRIDLEIAETNISTNQIEYNMIIDRHNHFKYTNQQFREFINSLSNNKPTLSKIINYLDTFTSISSDERHIIYNKFLDLFNSITEPDGKKNCPVMIQVLIKKPIINKVLTITDNASYQIPIEASEYLNMMQSDDHGLIDSCNNISIELSQKLELVFDLMKDLYANVEFEILNDDLINIITKIKTHEKYDRIPINKLHISIYKTHNDGTDNIGWATELMTIYKGTLCDLNTLKGLYRNKIEQTKKMTKTLNSGTLLVAMHSIITILHNIEIGGDKANQAIDRYTLGREVSGKPQTQHSDIKDNTDSYETIRKAFVDLKTRSSDIKDNTDSYETIRKAFDNLKIRPSDVKDNTDSYETISRTFDSFMSSIDRPDLSELQLDTIESVNKFINDYINPDTEEKSIVNIQKLVYIIYIHVFFCITNVNDLKEMLRAQLKGIQWHRVKITLVGNLLTGIKNKSYNTIYNNAHLIQDSEFDPSKNITNFTDADLTNIKKYFADMKNITKDLPVDDTAPNGIYINPTWIYYLLLNIKSYSMELYVNELNNKGVMIQSLGTNILKVLETFSEPINKVVGSYKAPDKFFEYQRKFYSELDDVNKQLKENLRSGYVHLYGFSDIKGKIGLSDKKLFNELNNTDIIVNKWINCKHDNLYKLELLYQLTTQFYTTYENPQQYHTVAIDKLDADLKQKDKLDAGLERNSKLDADLKQKAKLEAELKQKAKLEAELKQKAKLEAELKQNSKLEAELNQNVDNLKIAINVYKSNIIKTVKRLPKNNKKYTLEQINDKHEKIKSIYASTRNKVKSKQNKTKKPPWNPDTKITGGASCSIS